MKKRRPTGRALNTSLVIAIFSLLPACGQGPYRPLATKDSAQPGTSAFVVSTSVEQRGDFTCPLSPSIEPDYDFDLNGSGYFRGCNNNKNLFQSLLVGQIASDDRVCVIPAYYVDRDQVYVRSDSQNSGPAVQCSATIKAREEKALVFTFTNIVYNSVFVVEGRFKDQMVNCLKTSNYYGCPHYSFGKFR